MRTNVLKICGIITGWCAFYSVYAIEMRQGESSAVLLFAWRPGALELTNLRNELEYKVLQ